MSDKISFKTKIVTRSKGHFVIKEVSIHQEDIKTELQNT